MAKMTFIPINLDDANAYVERLHRHHTALNSHKFSLAAVKDGKIVGVAIVQRPCSRHRDDGLTLEVARLCTDGTRNACSFLYDKCAKAAFALGYTKIGTYILEEEPGTTLKAVNWTYLGIRGGGSWNNASRKRVDKHPLGKKKLFEAYSDDYDAAMVYPKHLMQEVNQEPENNVIQETLI